MTQDENPKLAVVMSSVNLNGSIQCMHENWDSLYIGNDRGQVMAKKTKVRF